MQRTGGFPKPTQLHCGANLRPIAGGERTTSCSHRKGPPAGRGGREKTKALPRRSERLAQLALAAPWGLELRRRKQRQQEWELRSCTAGLGDGPRAGPYQHRPSPTATGPADRAGQEGDGHDNTPNPVHRKRHQQRAHGPRAPRRQGRPARSGAGGDGRSSSRCTAGTPTLGPTCPYLG